MGTLTLQPTLQNREEDYYLKQYFFDKGGTDPQQSVTDERLWKSFWRSCPICGNNAFLIYRFDRERCAACWANLPNLISKVKFHNNRATLLGLPATLTIDEAEQLYNRYDQECPLTGSKNLVLDHWISLDTGFGGTFIGNLVFIDKRLHESKGNRNPFQWLQENNRHLSFEKVLKLIGDLASQNHMTLYEFEKHVSRCYKEIQPFGGNGPLNIL